ncbi:hypothetical protein KA517_01775 [Candidatus Gracilibacteria bacterium]|nr:hypothetical protein [Candidatus Gracilibacteria bacterium]
MLNAPAGAPPENNERDVNQLYEAFLAQIDQPLQLALNGLGKRAKLAKSIDTRLPVLRGIAHRLAARVAKSSGAAKVLDDSLLTVYARTIAFLQTLSDTELLRLADQRQFLVHYGVREVNDHQQVVTACVYITDIPHPAARAKPTDNYLNAVLNAVRVIYQYPLPFPKEISGIDTSDRMIRSFPAANDDHYKLKQYIVECRTKLRNYAKKVAHTANQLLPTADPGRQQKLKIVVAEAEIVSGLCQKNDVMGCRYQEIFVRSLGYSTPDMRLFQDRIDKVASDLYKRVLVSVMAAGIDDDAIAQHTSTGQSGVAPYRREPGERD